MLTPAIPPAFTPAITLHRSLSTPRKFLNHDGGTSSENQESICYGLF